MDPTTNSFLVGLGQLIYYGTYIYVWLVIIRVLLTWINPNPYTPVMRLLTRLTDPVLNRARRLMPLTLGGLDFSPLLALIILNFLGLVLGRWLWSLGLGAPASMLLPLAAMALLSLLDSLAWFLMILMGARVLMSLVHPSPYNILVQIVYGLTEPLLAPLRRFFPPGPGGFDTRALVFLGLVLVAKIVLIDHLAGLAMGWIAGVAGAPR